LWSDRSALVAKDSPILADKDPAWVWITDEKRHIMGGFRRNEYGKAVI
jgi:hypothetical protein